MKLRNIPVRSAMNSLAILALFATCLGLSPAAHGADGDFDLNFGTDGVLSYDIFDGTFIGSNIAIQPDGNILIAGAILPTMGDNELMVIRIDQNGDIDNNFGVNGEARVNVSMGTEEFRDMVVNPDGSILITGTTSSSDPDQAVLAIKLDSNGVLDPTFGTGGIVISNELIGIDDHGERIALDSSGRIFIGMRHNIVLALLPDGARDLPFGGGGGRVTSTHAVAPWALAVDNAGRIVSAGGLAISRFQDPNQKILATRYLSDGSLDTSFGDEGLVTITIGSSFHAVYDLVIAPDGKIYLSVISHDSGIDSAVVRLLSDGTLDTTYGVNGVAHVSLPGNGTVYTQAIELLPDGRIVVSGYGSSSGTFNEVVVVVFESDGSLDNTFGLGGWQEFDSQPGIGYFFVPSGRTGIAIHPSGRIFLADANYCLCAVSLMAPAWDLSPDVLPFATVTDAEPSSTQQSSAQVSGLGANVSVPFRVTGGLASTDHSPVFSSLPEWLSNGELVTAQHVSSETPDESVITTIEAGGIRPRNNRALMLGSTVLSTFESTAGTPTLAAEFDEATFGNLIDNPTFVDFEGFANPGEFLYLGNPGQFVDKGVTFDSNSAMFLQNNDAYGTGAFLSPQQSNPEIVDITLPPNIKAIGFQYQSATATLQIDGGQIFNLPAINPGLLGFIGVARENPIGSIRIEVAGPSIDIDNFQFSDEFQFAPAPLFVAIPDIGDSTSPEIAVAIPGSNRVHIRDGSTDALITDINFGNDAALQMAVVADPNANGNPEIAMLNEQASGQVRVQIRDTLTGAVTKNLYYGLAYEPVAMDVIDDYSGNGLPEIAVLGSDAVTDAVRVQVQDTSTGFLDNIFLGTQSIAHDLVSVTDTSGNGIPEIGILGVLKSSDQVRSQLWDADTAAFQSNVWFGNVYQPHTTITMPDINSNGSDEIVAMGVDPATDNIRVQVRDSDTTATLFNIWLGAVNEAVDVALINDINSDGVADIAVLLKTPAGVGRVRVQSGSNGAFIRNLFYTVVEDPVGMAVMPDYNGGGFDELAVLGESAGVRHVQILDTATGTQVNRIDFP